MQIKGAVHRPQCWRSRFPLDLPQVHVTRVMTTAIALETSKGNLALALGLGLVLMIIAIAVNTAATLVGRQSAGPRDA